MFYNGALMKLNMIGVGRAFLSVSYLAFFKLLVDVVPTLLR